MVAQAGPVEPAGLPPAALDAVDHDMWQMTDDKKAFDASVEHVRTLVEQLDV